MSRARRRRRYRRRRQWKRDWETLGLRPVYGISPIACAARGLDNLRAFQRLMLEAMGAALACPARVLSALRDPPSARILIFARNYIEAAQWAESRGLNRRQWVYPTRAEHFTGFSHSHYVQLAGFWERRHADDLQHEIEHLVRTGRLSEYDTRQTPERALRRNKGNHASREI